MTCGKYCRPITHSSHTHHISFSMSGERIITYILRLVCISSNLLNLLVYISPERVDCVWFQPRYFNFIIIYLLFILDQEQNRGTSFSFITASNWYFSNCMLRLFITESQLLLKSWCYPPLKKACNELASWIQRARISSRPDLTRSFPVKSGVVVNSIPRNVFPVNSFWYIKLVFHELGPACFVELKALIAVWWWIAKQLNLSFDFTARRQQKSSRSDHRLGERINRSYRTLLQ